LDTTAHLCISAPIPGGCPRGYSKKAEPMNKVARLRPPKRTMFEQIFYDIVDASSAPRTGTIR